MVRDYEPDEEGIWVVGPTTDHPVPKKIIEGTWQEAQDHCKSVDKPWWVQGKVEWV